jgi:threonine synthase
MDVGNPSNMERLRDLCGGVEDIRNEVSAVPVSDDEIRATILDEHRRHRLAWCPHTATGLHVYRHLPENERRDRHWIVVATAHPAKFDSIVEPLIGHPIVPPPDLARLLALPSHFETVAPELGEIVRRL